ncbi:MAG: dihydropteroate synthase [Candidatus Zixiibacteriota bacterium]|nr:MAG: dihydropteroate synthase [candidate division Zixibacteria bacterium]
MQKQTLTGNEEITSAILLRGGRKLPLDRTLVMGVLNVTPDSFSDGARFNSVEAAVDHAVRMVEEGANIIDIGGESTRPGADPVDQTTEQERVVPVIERLRKGNPVPISVDTYNASTAKAGIEAGADIVNDISALRSDPEMASLVAALEVPVVLMHMQGKPKDMQTAPSYADCVREIGEFFEERIEYCRLAGIDRSRLILDPGIGFGKRLSDNLEILARLEEFRRFGLPLLIGASRKSFIGMLHPDGGEAAERLGGSIAAAVMAVQNGADMVRVHDVAQTVEALKVARAIGESR